MQTAARECKDESSPSEFGREPTRFTHLDQSGKAKMVNIGWKTASRRTASARGEILVGAQVLAKIREQSMRKGDIITVSKIAGILGAKQTSQLIPMCHQVPLDHVQVRISESPAGESLIVEAEVETSYRTGVEMECLTAVSVTLLTIYDMCKSANKFMTISDIRLVTKTK